MFLIVFLKILFTNIYIAPSVPDYFTADLELNKHLFSSKEAAELFKDCEIHDLLRPLLNFTLIPITIHSSRSQNLLNNKH
jgi:hypothetical protein